MQISQHHDYSWKPEQKEGFRLVVKRIIVSCKDTHPFKKIPEFWNDCQRNGIFAKLISMDTAATKGIFGLFGAYDEQLNTIEYSIMVISNQEQPQGFTVIDIPNAVWAVFDCREPRSAGNTEMPAVSP